MFYQLHQLASSEFFRKEYGENFSFPPHLHQCFELIVLLSGEMTVYIDNEKYLIKKGEALLIFPNQLHSLHSEKSEHMLYIFSPKLIQAFSIKRGNSVPQSNRLNLENHFISTLEDLTEGSSLYEVKGALYFACGIFDKTAEYKPFMPYNNNLLYIIFEFVDTNFNKDCSLKELAINTGYDYAYLSRYFKRSTGISYNDYLNSCRLDNAGYILKNSTLSVLECAQECGYSSLRTFNQNFKECYGVSPKQYRKT